MQRIAVSTVAGKVVRAAYIEEIEPDVLDGRDWTIQRDVRWAVLNLSALHNAKSHQRRRQVGWASRRQVGETGTAGPPQIITPRAVGRQPHQQIIQ
jgi:hypothetical protein